MLNQHYTLREAVRLDKKKNYICKGTVCSWVQLCNDAVFIFAEKEKKRPDTRGQTRRNQVIICNNFVEFV